MLRKNESAHLTGSGMRSIGWSWKYFVRQCLLHISQMIDKWNHTFSTHTQKEWLRERDDPVQPTTKTRQSCEKEMGQERVIGQ